MATRAELNRFNGQAQRLGEAAAKGDVKTVNAMLAEEPALVTHTRPFSDACKAGQPETVLALIRAGANVQTTDGSGPPRAQKALLWTIRPIAWSRGHLRVLEILLDHGADPNGGTIENRVTPLVAAAEWNHPEAISLLIARGAQVGFWEAVAIGDLARVEAELERSPDLARAVSPCVGIGGAPGTPLHFAGMSRLGSGDVAIANRLGAIAHMLIARGAPPITSTIDGTLVREPIVLAARSDNVAVARVLLEHGAEPQQALAPALNDVAMGVLGLIDGARLDLNVGGDPKLGNTILHESIRYGRLRSAEWLLARSADATARDRNGWTALHYAGSRGVSPEFVQLLLDRGAPIDLPDASGLTPLALARSRGHGRLVELLEAAMLSGSGS